MIDSRKANELKKDFPILSRKIGKKQVVYLDNSATTQKPNAVIKKISGFYESSNSNIHRGMHALSMEATAAYEDARKTVARFIGADADEVIFTRSTTESLNLLSYTLSGIAEEGKKKILLTELEHHSNLIPWQELAKREGLKLEFVRLNDDFTLDEVDLKKKLDKTTVIFAFTAVSNSLGTIVDVQKLCGLAKKAGALSVVDAAQLVPHAKVDVKKLGCDFLAFSGHKMLGPSGVGVLYGKRSLLQMMPPFNFGGSMISEVSYEFASFAEPPAKFEAGTPNIEGAIGLAEAIMYLEKLDLDKISSWEEKLLEYALKKLKGLNELEIYSAGPGRSAAIISFNVKGVHAHDVASILNDYGVCVRAGHHCNMPLMKKLGIAGTVRASLYFYNTFEDVDTLAEALSEVMRIFRG